MYCEIKHTHTALIYTKYIRAKFCMYLHVWHLSACTCLYLHVCTCTCMVASSAAGAGWGSSTGKKHHRDCPCGSSPCRAHSISNEIIIVIIISKRRPRNCWVVNGLDHRPRVDHVVQRAARTRPPLTVTDAPRKVGVFATQHASGNRAEIPRREKGQALRNAAFRWGVWRFQEDTLPCIGNSSRECCCFVVFYHILGNQIVCIERFLYPFFGCLILFLMLY